MHITTLSNTQSSAQPDCKPKTGGIISQEEGPDAGDRASFSIQVKIV
jgi:hypothetical protein